MGALHVQHDGQIEYAVISVPKDAGPTRGPAQHEQAPAATIIGAMGSPGAGAAPLNEQYHKFDHKICIPLAGVAMDKERGNHQAFLIGDIAVACGARWFYGKVQVTEDDEYRPKCFWLGYGTLPRQFYDATAYLLTLKTQRRMAMLRDFR